MSETPKLETDDNEVEESKAPLLDHLKELRSRIIKAMLALVVGAIVSAFFLKPILAFLLGPYEQVVKKINVKRLEDGLEPVQNDLIATQILETFFVNVRLAIFGGIILAFPVFAYQLYRFIAPGLYKNERYAFLPFLILSPVLFSLGAALVFWGVFPNVLAFGLNMSATGDISLLPRISDYLKLATTLFIAFGLSFQLPIVLSLMGRAGIVSSKALRSGRRYAIIGIFVFAAFMTPPDFVSQIILGTVVCFLYEISIFSVVLSERKVKSTDSDA